MVHSALTSVSSCPSHLYTTQNPRCLASGNDGLEPVLSAIQLLDNVHAIYELQCIKCWWKLVSRLFPRQHYSKIVDGFWDIFTRQMFLLILMFYCRTRPRPNPIAAPDSFRKLPKRSSFHNPRIDSLSHMVCW